jgi:hypothetical protein
MALAVVFGYKEAPGKLGCGNRLKKIKRHLLSFRCVASYACTDQIGLIIVTAPGNRQDMIHSRGTFYPTVGTNALVSGNYALSYLLPFGAVTSSLRVIRH